RIASGMTFAMAGLLADRTEYQKAQFPLLGDIPIIGTLFRYVRHFREERELMIFVTPRLVRPMGPGEVPAAPGTTENNNTTDLQFFLFGMDRRPGSRTAEPAGTVGLQR
ncbi:MAG: type II and III secretion system protein family protein, partial [Myxococcota bacterium]